MTLVQGMENGYAPDCRVTGVACYGGKFVHYHGVGDVGFYAVADFTGNVLGNQASEVGGMFAHDGDFQVVCQGVIYFINS